ncbi:SRPBCC family protein [Arthrobacter sp. ISL-69]|uniref:SRPBCC family protein n=1 Tax=Arthrobacter sp. ISL-69 TaxID=2819113 RepID=UPI001BE87F0B|nr:SRPBCC family protein [Arthrobacter sp. ISL-69]MBT2537756.1 SRPBCC family protein [Arthrobacter sp. ISL-69]
MSTKVDKRILVNVPASAAYNQWTQFEEFPHFMGGVKSVTQLSDDRLEWVAEIAGVRRKWEAKILEQVPDRKVAWAATEGATNAGTVTFEDVGGGQTSVQLSLEYEPEGIVETLGDKLNVVDRQVEADLKRFKDFIEDEGYASGAWRGTVNEGASPGTPGVDAAAASRGDSGKAGVSGKVAAGLGVAAAAAAGVAASMRDKDTNPALTTTSAPLSETTVPPVPPTNASGYVEPTDGASATADSGSALSGERIAKPFDQTNGLVDFEGDSDQTAASDTRSAAERKDEEKRDGGLPPAAGSLGQH